MEYKEATMPWLWLALVGFALFLLGRAFRPKILARIWTVCTIAGLVLMVVSLIMIIPW